MINYSCCNLYLLFIIFCTVFDFGDCSIDMCLVYCIVLYCIVFVLFVCYVFFLTSFMSDCCMTEFVDLRNDMCECM